MPLLYACYTANSETSLAEMPRYIGNPDYSHDRPGCTGVLVTNLGTPDEPTAGAVRRYLAEFLSDPRVIETPRILWWPILHGIILRVRPRRSARAYRKIWTEQGSPLLQLSERLVAGLREKFKGTNSSPLQFRLGMRYGKPSIEQALETLRTAGVTRLLVLPLYPQYSAPTTASTFDAVSAVLQRWRWLPELRFIASYHDHPAYLDTLAESVRSHWQQHGQGERLLMSFHGLPLDYFLAGDPYFCQCQRTARELAKRLSLSGGQWAVTFQSRFGPRQWLQPYTDKTLEAWGQREIGNIDVMCPGFAIDCLETLEEIQLQNAEIFRAAGGGELRYIPALNDSAEHTTALMRLINEHTQGWAATPAADLERRPRAEQLAAKLGVAADL
jgi:ferrochelatase